MTEQAVNPSVELVQRVSEGGLAEMTPARIALVARTIAPKDATADEVALFIAFCQSRGMNPLDRQVYLMKNKGRVSIITSVDGLRLMAQRSGEFEGQVGPEWKATPDGAWLDVPTEGAPYACRAGVIRTGTGTVWATLKFSEFDRSSEPGGDTWRARPCHMIGIRAETHALRKAFPAETSGVRVNYEGGVPTGLDIDDPEKPIDYPRLGHLMAIAKSRGWKRQDRLDRAGTVLGRVVDSFSKLTRGEAAEVIAAWESDFDSEVPDLTVPGDESVAEVATGAGASEDVPAEGPDPSTAQEGPDEVRITTPSPSSPAGTNVQGKRGASRKGKAAQAPRPADTSGEPAIGSPQETSAGHAAFGPADIERPGRSSDIPVEGRTTRPGAHDAPSDNARPPGATASTPSHEFVGDGLLCEVCSAAAEHPDHKGAR